MRKWVQKGIAGIQKGIQGAQLFKNENFPTFSSFWTGVDNGSLRSCYLSEFCKSHQAGQIFLPNYIVESIFQGSSFHGIQKFPITANEHFDIFGTKVLPSYSVCKKLFQQIYCSATDPNAHLMTLVWPSMFGPTAQCKSTTLAKGSRCTNQTVRPMTDT